MTRAQKALMKKAKAKVKEIKNNKSIKKAERIEQAEAIMGEVEKQVAAGALLNPLAGGLIRDGHPCMICGGPIKLGQHHRIIGYKGDDPYARHENCAPGTEKWLKSEVGKSSAHSKYFKEATNE